MEITGKQRSYLKSMAHSLKPVILIGKSGISQESIQSIQTALADHELIKVRFIVHKEEKKRISAEILDKIGCEFVGMVGNVLILYKRQEDPDKRKYKLP